MESCSKINDGSERLALGECEVRRTWKDYFEDLYIIDTQDQGCKPQVWLWWCLEK